MGEIRQDRSGLGTAWVRCSITAARRVSGSRPLVGFVSARVQLLQQWNLRCFRCHDIGSKVSGRAQAKPVLGGTSLPGLRGGRTARRLYSWKHCVHQSQEEKGWQERREVTGQIKCSSLAGGGVTCVGSLGGSPTPTATTATTASMRRPSTRWKCAQPGRLNVVLLAVVKAVDGSGTLWDAVSSFCEAVVLEKESAERTRETSAELAIRRKRPGHRRAAQDRRLPP